MNKSIILFFGLLAILALLNEGECQATSSQEPACNPHCRSGISKVLQCCKRQNAATLNGFKAGYSMSAACDTRGRASCTITPKCDPRSPVC